MQPKKPEPKADKASAAPKTDAPSGLKKAQLDAQNAREEADRAYYALLEKRQKADEAARLENAARRKAQNEANRENRNKRTVWVIVQQRRNKPVRLNRTEDIPCCTPVQVSPQEVRRLRGMRMKRGISLIVGELAKPGQVVERQKKVAPAKAKTAKEA